MNTDVVIIGCGAAGLMAAVTAGELGVRCVALERRHRPGLKLLMCGNNRCNVSHEHRPDEMLREYGGEQAVFLKNAIEGFSPQALRQWFRRNGLETTVKNDHRIYPVSEKADDVLHCFMDRIRDLCVPVMYNSPVEKLEAVDGGWRVTAPGVSLTCRTVLVATGGVSYPKTGSVGDGQRLVEALGGKTTPLRAGLAGVDVADEWIQGCDQADFTEVAVRVFRKSGEMLGETHGNMLCQGGCVRGKAIFDATRLAAHENESDICLTVDVVPGKTASQIDGLLTRGSFAALGIPVEAWSGLKASLPQGRMGEALKALPLKVLGIRPLKEAIVTVGGIALSELDSRTMALRRFPGVFAAGEVVDIDGPTGGYNLHAAFATAHLAVTAIAKLVGCAGRPLVRPGDGEGEKPERGRIRQEAKGGSARQNQGEARGRRLNGEERGNRRRDGDRWGDGKEKQVGRQWYSR